MSKSTKIIAALGVVAGLGVAALPAFTYAVETTGNVEVDVEVLPAIAMTIEGNNDNGEHYHPTGATYSYTAVTPAGTENPSQEGWYVETSAGSGEYTLTTDTTIQSGTTYYKRTSSAFNPVDNSAPTGVLVVDGHPAATIAGTSSSYASLLPNAVVEGGTFKSTITVYTNANSGYDLTLNDGDTNNALVHDTTSSYTIPAVGTQDPSNAVAAGSAAWGYRVSSQHGSAITPAAWAAVPLSTDTGAAISTMSTKTTGGDQTVVEYGVSTSADQATGVYKDVIVYTATTK